jgi:quercetin dioxygenase-like cupin family protein
MHITTLNPGAATHPPAHHAQEEVIWVKEGTLELWLNGKTQKAGEASFIFLAANAQHSITNAGDKPATYYVIDVYTAATATVHDGPADEWAPTDKLRSAVFDCNSITEISRPTGSRRPIVDSPTTTFVRLESHITMLNVGATTGPLNDGADEIIIIKSGLIESNIKGVTCRLGPGSFYFQRANDIHSSTNAGSTPASYQVIKIVSEIVPKPVP